MHDHVQEIIPTNRLVGTTNRLVDGSGRGRSCSRRVLSDRAFDALFVGAMRRFA
ncbi:hypothetical protein SAMN04488074_103429 [Lentzea albidocapillata subsp. violacea]|uniref:Uncharacterized protein n=1 Tax=Lentzea albidocapillata subsp. violacea TaxID=128104 RepID=A0A1G8XBR6_9PSEU|nr:hypothetical protein SAMN04488074_103429 [Lentzea albidocapillata subsp. violacea]